jgi:hypothetical protein
LKKQIKKFRQSKLSLLVSALQYRVEFISIRTLKVPLVKQMKIIK